MEELAKRLEAVRERIARAGGAGASRSRRNPTPGRDKVFPAEAILAAHALGLREFGENYVQEFEARRR